ncbi:hypothetical protein JOC54_003355 [Alkalihalobacillus xiaoxiensis]|uniref:Uncharacterized protein n=1 Tax=Shouchella xiaoxiensis TaxID=766895 RepID=A0ABS2SZ64_9BACI|nr:hypothetical protein [Shouchella xiaoxiensis]MBM7840075.1 hypothetical protein [Shouchella xiaoxiensis]
MSWGNSSYGCGCNSYGNYDNNNYGSDCNCDSFFKHIARGEYVKVILKGGEAVKGSFVAIKGDTVELANADCHHESDCKCDKKKVRIITICCDEIVAVEV